MQKLEITYQDRLYGHYEKDLKKPYFYLNKSFDIRRLTIDGKDISYSYEDECFMFVTTIKRSNSNDPELDDGYEFKFSFYLKTLGGLGN